MEKFGTYMIIPEKPLIVGYYNGIIKIEDIIHFNIVIRKEPNYNYFANTILDFRYCTLDIKHDELPKIINYIKSSFKKTGDRKVAYLTSKPNEVVVTSMYQYILDYSDLNYNPKIFSTVKAIANFFGNKVISEKELLGIIEELKTKPNIL
ncbi:MAG: hypothetical protein U0W24_19600 [Bacteroidales bacterium]